MCPSRYNKNRKEQTDMATPRVFISSTCYDLKHIRESLKYFVKTIGYEPVLSDDGDIYYNPSIHTHEACLDEVITCQIFVLIIGGRYGGTYKDTNDSITNEEYRVAAKENIPIFTLVDSAVHSDHLLYLSNKNNNEIDRDKIKYPASDNIKIFKFIEEVKKNSLNNAIHPFKNFSDIEIYLRKQWAGMMFDYLQKRKNDKQSKVTQKILDDLSLASKKTEELVKYVFNQLDKTNAQEIINTVSSKAQADMFAQLILRTFDLRHINFKNFTCDTSRPWYEFLQCSADFNLEELDDVKSNSTELVLFDPNFSTGITVKQFIDDEVFYSEHDEIEKAYESLTKLSPENIKSVLSQYSG